MPTLTGTLSAITGAALDPARVLRMTVRAPYRRASLADGSRLVSSVPEPVEVSPTGAISVDLDPGPAVLVMDGVDGRDVYELHVTADMTLLTQALAESAPDRSWVESQMVQLKAGAAEDARKAELQRKAADLAAAEARGDRQAIELLRAELVEAAEQNAAPHLTKAALNATYQPKGSYVPANLAVTFIYHGSNGSAPRGDAPGRRIWVGTVLPAGFQEGVDLLMRPVTTSPGDLPSATLVEDLPATGLQSVWDADTIGLPSGSTVATWADQVGAVHMSGVSGPTVNTDAGRTFVTTDGTASYVQASSGLVVGQPLTIAVVGRYVDAIAQALLLGSTVEGGLTVGVNSTGFMYSYAGGSVPGPPVDDQWHVFLLVHNSPTSEFRLDGAVVASGNFGTRGLTGGIRFGAGGPNGRTGLNIAAAAVWDRVLTTDERAEVSTKLMARYAIGV